MLKSDPFEILLAHDRWATQNILKTCSELPAEQFHQRFEMGPGSLHDTTTHILGAMRSWGDLLAGRESRPRLEGIQRTPAELLSMLEDIASDFATSVSAHPAAELVSRTRDGKNYTFTRGGVITHVMTHGMHHRAMPEHVPPDQRQPPAKEQRPGVDAGGRFT